MEYRNLGSSSMQVSSICLGCMQFGSRTDEANAMRIIHAAIDAGVNFLDTASLYNDGCGEEIVGKALAEGGRRDKVVLATKASRPESDAPNDKFLSRYHIMHECEASLRRLRTDHIDLYQFHRMDLRTPLHESLRAMDDLVRQGKVVYPGCSKFAPAFLAEAMMLCNRYGWARFISEQPPYSLVDRSIENELVWTCLRHGLGIIPWAPLGAGILSGKYRLDGPQPEGGRFEGLRGRRLTRQAIGIADALKPLAARKGCTVAELSLAWVRQQKGVTAPIVGVRTMEHLDSALRSLDLAFTAEEFAEIDAISPPGTAASNYYNSNVYGRLRIDAGLATPAGVGFRQRGS